MLTFQFIAAGLELLSILDALAQAEVHQYLSSPGFLNTYAESHHTKLNAVYAYSVNHFTEKITIKTVADLANLTPAAFCRFFKVRTGQTYLEYLTGLRINYACMLLAENRYPVSEICFLSGYQNLSNFNRYFKTLKGMSPSEYQYWYYTNPFTTTELV